LTVSRLLGWLPLLGLLAAVVLAMAAGRVGVSWSELWRVLAHGLGWPVGGQPVGDLALAEAVVWQVRGPRVLAAVLVGAGLAMAGAAFQGLFRNPLVSPDILGASAGAALGAVLGIFWGWGVLGIQLMAFAGGLLAVLCVFGVGSALRQGDPVLLLILTGVVIGSLLGAGIGLIKYLADPYNQLPAITFWLLGSLAATTPGDLKWLAAPIALGAAGLLLLRHRLNAMSLSEDEARALGVNTTVVRWLVVMGATLVTSGGVALAGVIGWVGLVVPHMARFLVGPSYERLLPASALLGGGFLLLIDTLARSMATVEVPLGLLTAVVGTPFFIWLLRHAHRSWS
jgi:iron complex transport system permease protein